jgi:hypothetical protein
MSVHWFYARGFGVSHTSTLIRIFLDLRTTHIACDLIQLHKPSEVFNTLMPSRSECPAHMYAISEDFIMCSHIVHHYTFKYSTLAMHALRHVYKTFANMQPHIPSHCRSFRSTVPRLQVFFLHEAHSLRIFGIIHTRHANRL